MFIFFLFWYFMFLKKATISLLVVIQQNYKSGPEEEYVILGNDALMKCKIPSFVSDFVNVVSWLDNDGKEYYQEKRQGNYLVNYQNVDLGKF